VAPVESTKGSAVSRYRLLVATTVASIALAAGAVGILAWITFAPPTWFTDRYATSDSVTAIATGLEDIQSRLDDLEGSDTQTSLDDLSSRLDDLETGSGDEASTSVDDLSSRLDDLETGGGDEASSSVDDVSSKLDALCDAIGSYDGAFADIYLTAC
jgi:hypothetical protein